MQLVESDRVRELDLPKNGRLLTIAKSIESAMQAGKSAEVRRACAEFLAAASDFYRVPPCHVREAHGLSAGNMDFPLLLTWLEHNQCRSPS